jgi:hypothetical protein
MILGALPRSFLIGCGRALVLMSRPLTSPRNMRAQAIWSPSTSFFGVMLFETSFQGATARTLAATVRRVGGKGTLVAHRKEE